jgi:hypothetical protein
MTFREYNTGDKWVCGLRLPGQRAADGVNAQRRQSPRQFGGRGLDQPRPQTQQLQAKP